MKDGWDNNKLSRSSEAMKVMKVEWDNNKSSRLGEIMKVMNDG